jgi:4-amino-4-deoxy-L-arabinose transferase-like glycosyltransferase
MQKKTLFLLLVILVIAAFFRVWKLNEIPPGLYPDVAINGTQAFETLKTRNFKLFYPENNGREGLIMWLIALSFWIFGVSIWSIKIVAAIFGTLTVLGLFLLIKELFNNENLALLASFFLATSFSHTLFSRIGFRAILLPFVLVFSFYFLFKGFRKRKIRDFIIAGLFFGIGFYTYISFRFAVLMLFLILIC